MDNAHATVPRIKPKITATINFVLSHFILQSRARFDFAIL